MLQAPAHYVASAAGAQRWQRRLIAVAGIYAHSTGRHHNRHATMLSSRLSVKPLSVFKLVLSGDPAVTLTSVMCLKMQWSRIKSTAHQRQRPPLSRALSSHLSRSPHQQVVVEARAQAKHNAPVDSRRVQSARATERTSTSTGTHQRHQVSYAIPKSRARAASHPVSLLLLPLVRRQKR